MTPFLATERLNRIIRNGRSCPAILLVIIGVAQAACGGGSSVPPAHILVGMTANVEAVQVGMTAQFLGAVTGDPRNAGMMWSVRCAASSCGTVSPQSTSNSAEVTYTAPSTLPSSDLNVTLTATSIADPSAQASSPIVVPSVAVTVTPASVTVPTGGTAQFTASVDGDATKSGVTWFLFDKGCMNGCSINTCAGNRKCGTISSTNSPSGVAITYTAPANGMAITLNATSVSDKSAVSGVPITVSASPAVAAFDARSPALHDPTATTTLDAGSPQSTEVSPQNTEPEDEPGPDSKEIRYRVINLGTLGGSASTAFGGPNNRGSVTGDANLSGDQTEHGFLWRHGIMTDLGTLGGLNSSVPTPVKNERGLITGVAQTGVVDPLGEFWGGTFFCGAATCNGFQNLEVGFIWQDGVMTQLPTLGGNNGASLGSNDKGEVVGVAETPVRDANCTGDGTFPGTQVLDFRAVIWGPKPHEIRVLPPFPGDAVSAALAINDKSQVVGTSGLCQTPGLFAFAVHPVLWENGTPINLGGLGGAMFNTANAINNHGQVVGQSDLPGDTFTHAFFWENGVMTDLGTLPGDSSSIATDINEKGQVVGVSCDATGSLCRAFFWEDDVMIDLNTVIPSDSSLFLTYGGGINDRGEIAGGACVLTNGACTSDVPAFLAIPQRELENAQPQSHVPSQVTLPDNVRRTLQRRIPGFGGISRH